MIRGLTEHTAQVRAGASPSFLPSWAAFPFLAQIIGETLRIRVMNLLREADRGPSRPVAWAWLGSLPTVAFAAEPGGNAPAPRATTAATSPVSNICEPMAAVDAIQPATAAHPLANRTIGTGIAVVSSRGSGGSITTGDMTFAGPADAGSRSRFCATASVRRSAAKFLPVFQRNEDEAGKDALVCRRVDSDAAST